MLACKHFSCEVEKNLILSDNFKMPKLGNSMAKEKVTCFKTQFMVNIKIMSN